MRFASKWSKVPISLTLKFGETVLGTATGFLYQWSTRTYLVSNWHVFSGRDCYTGNPIDKKSWASPTYWWQTFGKSCPKRLPKMIKVIIR